MVIPQLRLKYLDRSVDKLHPWVIRFLNLIPFKCQFERKFHIGYRRYRIPKLCGLNPFYQQIIDTKLRIKLYYENKNNGRHLP